MCPESFGGVRFDIILCHASTMSCPGIHCIETQFLVFNALKFIESCTKSLITCKALHLEDFVKICNSATFFMATTWRFSWIAILIAK